MTGGQVDKYTDEVKHLIEQRLRIKGATLEKALSRSGRLLPKWAQREGRYLAQAGQFMGHPKLRLMIDEAKVEKAHKNLVEHLSAIDPSDRRKTRVLGTLGVVSFNLIIVAVVLVSFLMWRGYL
ncbi:hypothetical protein L0664_15585 [Octadecabacter sp. G9-8]|uniref:Uncharacterized protein n=1 Tax=Octadecabacter dasysiphoniae TaxID=2909341 RepID=A0ABS9D0D6_9RHOB|nr:hypothetical protein [Octadecabacter dasysiphoniae]MCF2872497.1 hypothetical protein [Octadecabacter dasysiphoniae]